MTIQVGYILYYIPTLALNSWKVYSLISLLFQFEYTLPDQSTLVNNNTLLDIQTYLQVSISNENSVFRISDNYKFTQILFRQCKL